MPDANLPAFSNGAGALFAHPGRYLVLRCHGTRQPTAALLALLTHAGHLLLLHGWQHLLVDAQRMPRLGGAARQWVLHEWQQPRVPRPQELHLALVQPLDAEARHTLAGLLTDAVPGATCHTFADEATARRHTPWLA